MSRKITLRRLLSEQYPRWGGGEILAHVLCGEVYVDGERVTDINAVVSDNAVAEFRLQHRFVSRGGDKLNAILEEWGLDVRGRVFLDAGASTGGFTDCLLQRGAAFVYCVDVGYNVLDYRLRVDPRTEVLERTNIMDIDGDSFRNRTPDAAVMDLSFRSIRGAAEHLLKMTVQKWAVALVKPQFEWMDPPGTFRGIVHDRKQQSSILKRLRNDLASEGVYVNRAGHSALRGRKGNHEYFFLLEQSHRLKNPIGVDVLDSLVC